MLPLRARVYQGAMAIKGYSAFPKPPSLLESHNQIVYCPIQDTRWWGSYTSAAVQSVYSTAPCDRVIHRVNVKTVLFRIIQFSISTQFRCQNSSISSNSV